MGEGPGATLPCALGQWQSLEGSQSSWDLCHKPCLLAWSGVWFQSRGWWWAGEAPSLDFLEAPVGSGKMGYQGGVWSGAWHAQTFKCSHHVLFLCRKFGQIF